MPPHWIFAFDDFLKTTVMTSIEFLDYQNRSDESVCDNSEVPPSLQQSISMTSNCDLENNATYNKYKKVRF